MREDALAATQQSVARLEDLLRRTIAQRDVALAVAAQRGVLLDRVTWCIGGAAALAILLHSSKAMRRAGSEVQVGGDATAGRPPAAERAWVAAAGTGVVVSHDASSLVGPQWSGPPSILGAGGSTGSAPS